MKAKTLGRLAASVVATACLVWAADPGAALAGAAIGGTGIPATLQSPYRISLAAGLAPTGAAKGYASVCPVPLDCGTNPTDGQGLVFEVVPPSASTDHWCAAAWYLDVGYHLLVYVRDVGPPGSGVDEVGFRLGPGPVTCATHPTPDQFFPLVVGDFAAASA